VAKWSRMLAASATKQCFQFTATKLVIHRRPPLRNSFFSQNKYAHRHFAQQK